MFQPKRGYRAGDEIVPGYHLAKFLGKGQFGEVWQAKAPGGMDVALKTIDLEGREGLREFVGLQRVKAIHHPNLVPLFASWLRTDDGRTIDEISADMLTMPEASTSVSSDLVDMLRESDAGPRPVELIIAMGLGSESLFDRLAACRKAGMSGIPLDELLPYMDQAAQAIDYLNRPIHNLGHGPVPIIHGDIKPHNLLIVGDAVQVCDFGLARAVESMRKTMTAMGTCAYAAPELLEGKPHLRSDQYCLAVSYYEMRTGDLPFTETNPIRVAERHRLGKLDFSLLPEEEQLVLRRGTSPVPERRWPSCYEMVRALRAAIEGVPYVESAASMRQSPRQSQGSGLDQAARQSARQSPRQSPRDTLHTSPRASAARPEGTLLLPGEGRDDRYAVDTDPSAETMGQPVWQGPARSAAWSARRWLSAALALLVVGLGVGIVIYVASSRLAPPPAPRPGDLADWKNLQEAVEADRWDDAVDILRHLPAEIDRRRREGFWDWARGQWKERLDSLAKEAKFVRAERMLADAPPELVDKDKKSAYRETVRGAWKQQFETLAKAGSVAEASKMINAADTLLFSEEEKVEFRKRLNEINEQLAMRLDQVHRLVRDGKFGEIVEYIQKLPGSEADKEELWKAAREGWRERIDRSAAQYRFQELATVLKQAVPELVPEADRKRTRDAARSTWRRRFTGLVAKAFYDQAAKLLQEECPPELFDDTERDAFREEVVSPWREQFRALVKSQQYREAAEMLDGAPSNLVDKADKSTYLQDLYAALLSALERSNGTQDAQLEAKRRQWNDLLMRSFRDRPESKLQGARALVRDGNYQAALTELNASALKTLPDHLQPLYGALSLIASRYGSDNPPADLQAQLVRLDELRKKIKAPAFWDLNDLERSLLEDIRRERVQQMVPLLKRQIDAGQFAAARDTLKEAEGLPGGDPRRPGLEVWGSVIEFRDPQSTPEAMRNALARVEKRLPAAAFKDWLITRDLAFELSRAMGQLTQRKLPAADQAALLDRAILMARGICGRYPGNDLVQELAGLWKRRIQLRVAEPNAPKADEFDRLQEDWERAERAGTQDALVDTWRAECRLELDREPARARDLVFRDAEKLPDEQAAYQAYVRAAVLATDAQPDWSAVLRELGAAVPNPAVPSPLLKVQNRLGKLGRLVVRVAEIRRREVARPLRLDQEPLLGNPFPSAAEADQYYQLLTAAAPFMRSAPNAPPDRALDLTLALAAMHKSKPDVEQSCALASSLAALPEGLSEADAVPVLYGCVRSTADRPKKTPMPPEGQKLAVRTCTTLLRRLDAAPGSLSNANASVVYGLVSAVRPLADAGAGAVIDRAEFYADAGRFLWKHKYAKWPVEDLNREVAGLMTASLDQYATLDAAQQPKERLVEYHLIRGNARVEQVNPKWDDVLGDADAALRLKPDAHGPHGLRLRACLLRSRTQLTLDRCVADLEEAIRSGQTAIDKAPPGDELLPEYLVNMSSACLEKANFLQDSTFKPQYALLKSAQDWATKASQQRQRFPDFPFLALGNAYEDLAWLVEEDGGEDPVDNYRKALDAFQHASTAAPFAVDALIGKSRCYSKAVTATMIDPAQLGVADAKAALEKSLESLRKAAQLAPKRVEVHYQMALAAQGLARWDEADQHFHDAMDAAVSQKLPGRAMFVAAWAEYPFCNGKLAPAAQASEGLARLPALTPTPPLPVIAWSDAAKEAVLVRGRAQALQEQREEALETYDAALPADVAKATCADMNLLFARAGLLEDLWNKKRAEYEKSPSPAAAEAAIAYGQRTIRDAHRVASLALYRGTMCSARLISGTTHRNLYYLLQALPADSPGALAAEKGGVSAHLDEAIDELLDTFRLSPRRRDGYDAGSEGIRLLLEKAVALPAEQNQQKATLFAQAVQWQERLIKVTRDPERRGQRERDLEQMKQLQQVLAAAAAKPAPSPPQ